MQIRSYKFAEIVMLAYISLFFHTLVFADALHQKYVIGACAHEGLLSSFFAVLNNMRECEQTDKIPVVYWDDESLYYVAQGFNGAQNAWEYYFDPVSESAYERGDDIGYRYAPGGAFFFYTHIEQEFRDRAYELVQKYIKINRWVQRKIDSFYHRHMENKQVIGIHFRGTDRSKSRMQITPEIMVEAALAHADENTCFLIASDEQQALDAIKNLLHGRVVFSYDCYRSIDHQPLHKPREDEDVKYSKAQLGEDVLVEVALLAQCDLLVHTASSVSTAALYFNPEMPHACLSPQKKIKKKKTEEEIA